MKLTRSFSITLCLALLAPMAYAQSTPSATGQNSTAPATPAPSATSTTKGKTTTSSTNNPDKTTASKADTSKKLDEIVVVATRTPQEKSKTAASVSAYSAQDILDNNVSSPEDLTQYDVGVSADRSAGGGAQSMRSGAGVQDYNIRGLDGNRVLLIEDGIRANEIFSFQGNVADGRDFYDFDSLKSVQIVKSADSALYGGGALGGVVSYATKDPSDYLSQTRNPYYFSSGESFDSSDMSFSENMTFAARTGPVDYLLLYTRRDGQQQDISANTAIYGPAGQNPMWWNQNNFLGKVVYHLDDQNQLRLTGEYFNYNDSINLISATYPVPSFGGLPNASGVTANDTNNRDRISLDYQYTGRPNVDLFKNIQSSVYYQQTATLQDSAQYQTFYPNFVGPFNPPIGLFDPDVTYRNESYKTSILGANFQATYDAEAFKLDNEWTAGLDFSYSKQTRNLDGYSISDLTGATYPGDFVQTYPLQEIPPSDTTRFGAYVQDQIKPQEASWLTLTPALRFDYYNLSIDNTSQYLIATFGVPGVPYHNVSLTPAFSALAQVTRELSVYGNFERGFRNPNTEDLNAAFSNPLFGYESIPNPNLKSEQSYDFEIGVRGDYEPVKFSTAAFYNYYTNFIQQTTELGFVDPGNPGLDVFQSTNIPRAQIAGLEGHLELPLEYYCPSLEGFKIISACAYTEGTDLSTGQPLTTIDPFKIVNTLHYSAPENKWAVDLNATWVAQQTRVPNATPYFVPPSYYTLDLVGKYHVNDHVLLTAGVYNLTNQTYWLYQNTSSAEAASTLDSSGVARFSQPGINVRVGLTAHF